MALRTAARLAHRLPTTAGRSLSGFAFAGPKSLGGVLRLDKIADKSAAEVADVWYGFHDEKEGVIGLISKGKEGKVVVERARTCPFFIQPVFRDDGFFVLLSQYMEPSHFCLAYLEDYKMDPHSATPLLTFSIFNDLADTKDVSLVRCDILNRSITDNEGQRIVSSLIRNYTDNYETVKTFNQRPQEFNIDDYISNMSAAWKQADGVKGDGINGT